MFNITNAPTPSHWSATLISRIETSRAQRIYTLVHVNVHIEIQTQEKEGKREREKHSKEQGNKDKVKISQGNNIVHFSNLKNNLLSKRKNEFSTQGRFPRSGKVSKFETKKGKIH